MEENISVEHGGPFVWVVYSLKRLKLGARNFVPKFLLVGEREASGVIDKLYSPFIRMKASNH